jgi:DNA-binding NarL/FixJ family response regulator
MTDIVIVDDHLIVRRGFKEMLNGEISFNVVYEAASGEELIQYLKDNQCDVILLDISLPGQNGVDVLKYIRDRYPKIKVLVLSGFPEEKYAMPMIKNGANGYICKDCEEEELIKAIHLVSVGRRYFSPAVTEIMASELLMDTEELPHERLSERELQVFIRLSQGESVSDIANVLNLSVKTISTYRTRLKEKMGLGSNAEMATYAVKNGLIEDGLYAE